MALSCEIPEANRTKCAKAILQLTNMRGLHARASNKFMEAVGRFKSRVWVRSHNDVCIEAASVMELLLLGAACGEEITVTAQGEDAADAIAAITTLVKGRFGENE